MFGMRQVSNGLNYRFPCDGHDENGDDRAVEQRKIQQMLFCYVKERANARERC